MRDDAQAFIEEFRDPTRPLAGAEQRRLSDDAFYEAVCHAIYAANTLADRPLLIEILREEMRLRRADGSHSGDRLLLCALLVALQRNLSDVFLFWEAKHIDFDMECYFDIQLLVFSGVETTMLFLRRQPGETAGEILRYLEGCRGSGDFADLNGYLAFKLAYFGLPAARAGMIDSVTC